MTEERPGMCAAGCGAPASRELLTIPRREPFDPPVLTCLAGARNYGLHFTRRLPQSSESAGFVKGFTADPDALPPVDARVSSRTSTRARDVNGIPGVLASRALQPPR